jgi:hypothetical protein
MKKILLLTVIIFIFSGMNIMAADWYVSTTGSNTTGNGTSGSPWQTIQFAIDNAAVVNGDIIYIAAGTYNETVTLNKRVSVIGAGSGTTGGTIITKSGGANGAINLVASGLSAIDPILIKNIRIQPTGAAGISVGVFTQATNTNVSFVKLENVKVIGTNTSPCTEQERGLYVDLTSSLTNLVVIGCSFDNLHYGWYFQKQVSADASTVRYLTVTGTSFIHNNWKGIYTEKLADAVFTNCVVSQNGVYDASSSGCTYFLPWMSGIDINLKAGTYQNLTFNNCTFTSNGLGTNGSVGTSQNGVGLAVKARGTGNDPSYLTFPATLAGVTINGGVYYGNERGIRIGEPGKNNTTPTGVSVVGAFIYNNVKTYPGSDGTTYGGMINFTTATVNAVNNWWGSSTGPYHATLNPTGTGNAVSDGITFSPWTLSPNTVWVDDDYSSGGTNDGHLWGYDAFATIQSAVTGVNAGGTINVAAGIYIESGQIVINKNISIVGADKLTTIIKPNQNTGSSGDARGWFLVNTGCEFNLSSVTLDGEGKQIFMAVLSHGTGTINNNIIRNMLYSTYYGMGLMMYGGNFTISNNTLYNIGRIGMYCNGSGVTNGVFSGNTYTGKGAGNWLDYGIEIEKSAVATCINNTITNCIGVAS